MDKIAYWDSEAGAQKERDATTEEQAEIDARRANAGKTPVPQEVTRRQGLHALFKKHRLTEQMVADKIIEMITDPDEQYLALTEFKTSQTFERNRPLVLVMGAALGLDLDELFIYAATL